MTEKTSQPLTEREYIPGLGKDFLTPLYDVAHHVFGLHPIHQRMITLAELRDGHRVLDVGCGTGNLLRATGQRHRNVDLFGLDPDPKALARAGRKARRAGLTVRLDRGFAQELPYGDGSFDRVFSSLMLHHLDSTSKDALLAEVRRVLRPDGLLVLADAVLGEHGHDHWHGRGRRQIGTRGRTRGGMRERMREQMRDNVGDSVSQRIAAAGFTVQPTRTMALRIGGRVGIELAHRGG
ncbi:class I SAM-dependent methyltransferase [Streptomyces cavernae]|uniref:class I SAM-dependent methyltransferase n=1 Tax=Streptomyces cavernae TaxID=2259034 RepID=UPI000FEB9D02|nr:class I SAM-dependent methyltransferase [Streptomyces cavernae]